MGEFNSDDHYIYYCGQDSLRRNGVAIIVTKRVWNAVLGCSLKIDRMIGLFPRHTIKYHSNLILFPSQEWWRSWSWTGLHRPTRPSRTNTKKDVFYITGDWNAKVGSQEKFGVTDKLDPGVQNEAGQRLTEFC